MGQHPLAVDWHTVLGRQQATQVPGQEGKLGHYGPVRHKLQARGSWCQDGQGCQRLSQSGAESQATLNSRRGLSALSCLIPGRLQSSGCSREPWGGGFYIHCFYFKSSLN